MEWQFRINWPALVEEAKQRRKAQKLTQARLARMAGVSTPTVSRFESGELDIQLPSALALLRMLGLIDQRRLTFPKDIVCVRDDPIRLRVLFVGKTAEQTRLACAITHEVLLDYFKASPNQVLKAFKKSQSRIEQLARRKYLSDQFEPDGSVLIQETDF